MKTKTFFAVALAALVSFASCSKEDNNINPKDDETTRVLIHMEQPGTRALGGTQDTQDVQFSNGYVYFVNGSTITNIFRLVSGTPTPETNEVKIGASMSFEEVDGKSDHIYIFGNVPTQTASVNDNISTVISGAALIESQNNSITASKLDSYYLYGKTVNAIDHSGTTSTASVTVKPIGTRIEIKQFKAVQKEPAATYPQQITGYRVDGIYMNNIYTKVNLDGSKTSTEADFTYNSKDNGNAPTKFVPGVGLYADKYKGITYDGNNSTGIATATSLVAKPAGTDVWAYNLLAPASAEFPHIVIKLSNIAGVPSINTATDFRWMTITKLLDSSDSSEVPFIPGYIYTIESLEFNEYDHLDVAPEMKTVTATVTVSVPEWVNKGVKPW